MRAMVVGVMLSTLTLMGCQGSRKPEAVVERLAEAVNAHDVEAGVKLFAPEAVVDTGDGAPVVGTEAIRGWLEELAAVNFGIRIEVVEVNGDTVRERDQISMDPWTELGIRSLGGNSEITVRDGLITALTFRFTDESLRELQTATLRATEPTHNDVAYIEDGDPRHLLDVYLPQEAGSPVPAIILVHGDGDTKEDHNGMAGFFNQAGFAAISIDYGDSSMIEDGLCATAWTHANAADLGLDPRRVTLFGFSVGGLVASTIGAVDDPSALLSGCDHALPRDGAVQGVAVYEGVFGTPEGCLSASWCLAGASAGTGIPLVELQPIFEALRNTQPNEWSDASVVGEDATQFAQQFPLYWMDGHEPPYLLIRGSEDQELGAETEAFAGWLERLGVEHQVLRLDGAGHQSVYPNLPSFWAIAGAIVEFAAAVGDS